MGSGPMCWRAEGDQRNEGLAATSDTMFVLLPVVVHFAFSWAVPGTVVPKARVCLIPGSNLKWAAGCHAN